ncbi:MAG: polysulfide reductase NrfD [candidate division KSB1 bacterium]|nr:polysulfide reductase NrfD [candidate division KSB1 bacterium]MDZ7300704.1 polysulfide reductase NrfD [candidate division KSB1 bacterium]MDZ7310026.1 polysulfide reductase NrfD [candidate division KSB1 bacterium]
MVEPSTAAFAPAAIDTHAVATPAEHKPAWSILRKPLILGRKTYGEVTHDICSLLDRKPTAAWWGAFFVAASVLGIGIASVTYLIATGVGVWGLNNTVGWAFDITNFVFWIGIGHAGTLISAILFLFRQRWRTSVNRSAEAMTIFAVICAGLFPIIHTGRPWFAYWLIPYPNTRGPLWVNFRSPLVWDMFAIACYFTISLVFWYVGLIPDLATLRDRTKSKIKKAIYSFFSLGWEGSTRTWHRYEKLYLLLAGLATPLVVSVHTIVSWDFATSIIPGWHTTILPPYFVAGAVFSGFAMVLTLMLITRKVMALEDYITLYHIEQMCKIIIATGGMVALAYMTELFVAYYSGNEYERFTFINRALGPYAWTYWTMVSCNVLVPQFFWFKKIRTNVTAVFILSIFINIGMWFERFVIVMTSLTRDYLPASWAGFTPTLLDIGTLMGSFGLFFTLFLLFARFLPMIAIGEVKAVLSYGVHPKGENA